MSQKENPCILIVQDDTDIAQLRQALSGAGLQVLEANTGEQALAFVAQYSIDLAIVERDLPGMDGYALCRQLRQRPVTRELPIMMLSRTSHIHDKFAAFDAGVDDYLARPFEAQELLYRIQVRLTRSQMRGAPPETAPTRGRLIALFGSKGGVGRTTIGVNLSLALQRRMPGRVVLVDGDFFFGDAALHLGLPPSHTILDLVTRIDHVDEELLEQVLLRHPSGLRVLLSPRDPEDVELIEPAHLARLLDLLACGNDYVVVDCQAIYDERTLTILERADAILLIIRPDVGSVKNMAIFSELAAKVKLAFDDKIHIVLNRAGSKSGIGAKEIERIFKRKIEFQIASGGPSVSASINRGVPLLLGQPKHPFAIQVTDMANQLIKMSTSREAGSSDPYIGFGPRSSS
ncbi:MAG: response regulator [Chloroflexi bacterium]|nr:response regulator [Chloroflexota bacterium]